MQNINDEMYCWNASFLYYFSDENKANKERICGFFILTHKSGWGVSILGQCKSILSLPIFDGVCDQP